MMGKNDSIVKDSYKYTGLLDDLTIESVTPEFIQQMAKATGYYYPTKEMCERNNPFKWIDIKSGRVSETEEIHTVTVHIRKGVNY